MPLDVVNAINSENEPEIHEYDQIKSILFKQYKISPEEFMQNFKCLEYIFITGRKNVIINEY